MDNLELKSHFMKEHGHLYDRLKPSDRLLIDDLIDAAAKGKHTTDDLDVIILGIIKGFEMIRKEIDYPEQPGPIFHSLD